LVWTLDPSVHSYAENIVINTQNRSLEYQYQGMMTKAGVADGIGRVICTSGVVYEGQFVNGVPLGWGNVIDYKLNHYEGFVKTKTDGSI